MILRFFVLLSFIFSPGCRTGEKRQMHMEASSKEALEAVKAEAQFKTMVTKTLEEAAVVRVSFDSMKLKGITRSLPKGGCKMVSAGRKQYADLRFTEADFGKEGIVLQAAMTESKDCLFPYLKFVSIVYTPDADKKAPFKADFETLMSPAELEVYFQDSAFKKKEFTSCSEFPKDGATIVKCEFAVRENTKTVPTAVHVCSKKYSACWVQLVGTGKH